MSVSRKEHAGREKFGQRSLLWLKNVSDGPEMRLSVFPKQQISLNRHGWSVLTCCVTPRTNTILAP